MSASQITSGTFGDRHAHVLLIPDLFDPEFCQELIQTWEQGTKIECNVLSVEGGKLSQSLNKEKLTRLDHYVEEGSVRDRINRSFFYGVKPEVLKAFQFEVTRFEGFCIACYDSTSGGYFRPHKDNSNEATAHRRFSISVNLNSEFEGGLIHFPEFGSQSYCPAAGCAIVFSSSLTHQVTDVKQGRRFVLISFLYGEAQEKIRLRYAKKIARKKPEP